MWKQVYYWMNVHCFIHAFELGKDIRINKLGISFVKFISDILPKTKNIISY